MAEEGPLSIASSRRRREIDEILAWKEAASEDVALVHFARVNTTKGWKCWHSHVGSALCLRKLARQAVRSLLNRNLRKGVNGWKNMMAQRAAALLQLRKAAASFRQRGVRAGLNTMIGHRLARQAALQQLAAAAGRWANQALSNGWRCWHAWRLLRLHLNPSAHPLICIRLQACLRSWACQRAVQSTAAASLLRRRQRRALHSWICSHELHTTAMGKLRKATSAMRRRHLRLASNTWHLYNGHETAVRDWQRLAARSWTQRGKRAAFNSLADRRESVADAMVLMSHARQHWADSRRAALSEAMAFWTHYHRLLWNAPTGRLLKWAHPNPN